MLALAIDTATEVCSIALGARDKVIDEIAFEAGRSHLEKLLPAVRRMFERQGLGLRELEFIAAGTGPGTFSGLRVGIATCRALSQALTIPVWGSSSLGALAAGVAASPGGQQQSLMAAINARRGQVFARLYRKHDRQIRPVSDIHCLSPEDLVEVVTRAAAGPVIAFGDGILAYHEFFSAAASIRPLPPQDKRHQVRAAHHLPAAGSKQRYGPGDPGKVLPVYIREPDADRTVLLRKRGIWQ